MPPIDPKKLETIRNDKDKTQKQVGKELGLTQGAYSTREKTGNFDENQIKIICKFLGIKKEQIEKEESIDQLTFLTNKAIQTESALTVVLGDLAELLAKATNGSVTKIRTDLESAVNDLSKQGMDKLQTSK